ncbi:hypothetical protein GKE73_05385 [Paludibacterium sp. dN 18-1]|uniref:WbqC-like protein n=2 Tax=Paludibacterium denitrificans TaxID=2675226 RepID=A0A844GBZ3_9NEIS|nr:hypothetical protein [Paludibacterium denitrificans]
MQPYFFPYAGHFSLIAHADKWIVFDVTQYTPKSWISRNRVLHPVQGWNWINVPLSNSSISIKIHEASILNLEKAKESVLGKLTHYRKKAPYYGKVIGLIEEVFALSSGDKSLVNLNVHSLDVVCRYLDIPFNRSICSELNLALDNHYRPREWALAICQKLGYQHYINPLGGKGIFNHHLYRQAGVTLEFLSPPVLQYSTPSYIFERELSIVDVLMWNEPKKIREDLMKGRLISADDG